VSSSPERPEWTVRRATRFLDQLDERRYRRDREAILRRVEELLKDPYQAARAERLRHEFAGLSSARILGGTRLIYRICEECRRLGDQVRRPLDCCLTGDTPDATVNILCLSEHYEGIPERFDLDV
jgi:Txe/YoeB family toxin of Txe-Axe toxin-antitoxin module